MTDRRMVTTPDVWHELCDASICEDCRSVSRVVVTTHLAGDLLIFAMLDMSKPDIVPKTSAAGIAVDPKTLERVIPESKRPDGS